MILELSKISLSYGSKKILSDIEAGPIAPGSLVGVLGANGVGKSSLLRSIAGMQKYDGNALLDGTPLKTLSQSERTSLVSYLPQSLPQSTSLIAYEAVLSAVKAVSLNGNRHDAEQLTEEVFQRLDILPLAFRSLSSLSGGQRQLVGLAQVIARKPSLMLLDEPTSALDLKWQLSVFTFVRSLVTEQQGICLMAIHDINLAMRHCDFILLLSGGKLLSFGPPLVAMTSENLRKAYGVSGRVEQCSEGTAFVIADNIASLSS